MLHDKNVYYSPGNPGAFHPWHAVSGDIGWYTMVVKTQIQTCLTNYLFAAENNAMYEQNARAILPCWMIYGANGYTGEMIAREAVRRGYRPVLAGRRREAVEALARNLGVEARTFSLDNPGEAISQLKGCTLVLNCAGPFSVTALPLMNSCLQTRTHYLDITGEIDVFEAAQSLNPRAQNAGIVLCPGVGFDVIPTDCVAAALKDAMPDAIKLNLGFDSRSVFSPGTAKTAIEGLAQGGKIRRDGKIITVPLAYDVRRIDFGDGEKDAMTIPWGDVSTAYYTTGIPDIQVFVPGSPRMISQARRANDIRPFLRLAWVQKLLKTFISRTVKGPGEEKRQQTPSFVWGEAINARGEKKTARIRTPNGYTLTIMGALTVVEYLMMNQVAGGAYIPARLMGANLVTQLPGAGSLRIV